MAVRINLVPDVRQAKIRTAQRRQMLTTVLIGVLVLCGLVAGGLFAVTTAQESQIKTLSGSISDKQAKLANESDLNKVLTTQQQIATLDGLLTSKRYMTKVLTIIQELSPSSKEISLQSMALDDTNQIKLTVKGRDFFVANRLVKALQASNTKVGSKADAKNAPDFTNVTMSEITSDSSSQTSFNITMQLADGVYDAKR